LLTTAPLLQPLTLDEFDASLASLAHFEARPFLAVAVSGGPDSLALALLADRWSRSRGGEICALTVNHQLRPESGHEARTVNVWMSARSIRHEVLIWSGEKPRTGIQEVARDARYRLLAGWCRANGCLHLLTAHHSDDQIETHLIRHRAHGGPDGLAGMSAIREFPDCRLLRPFLGVSSARLRALLESERQPFLSDPSNVDPAFERSRLRAATLGAADLGELRATILALGRARVAHQREVNAALGRFVTMHPAGLAVLDPAIIEAASHGLARRVLSAVVATIGGSSYPARQGQIARLFDALGAASRRGHSLGGCKFLHWRRRVIVVRELAHAEPPLQLTPGGSIFWDRRYDVSLAATTDKPFTIGYLAAPGVAQLNRLRLKPKPEGLPRLVCPILPAAWDEEGIAAVPHLDFRREGTAALPQFVFRPRNPLTQADFAVV
jgi:tRNA(Ile)-lysidine synthase